MSVARYPASSTPTEEETPLPELALSLHISDSHVRVAFNEKRVAEFLPAVQASVRRTLDQFKRDFAIWAAIKRSEQARTRELRVVLATHTPALDVDASRTALAGVQDDVVYLSYALQREGVPVGFRLGVFAFVFDRLAHDGDGLSRDAFIDNLAPSLLKDQLDVFTAPERYAMFADKDWLDALFEHAEKKFPYLEVQKAAGASAPATRSGEPFDKLSEEQNNEIAQLAARNRVDKTLLLKKMQTLVTVIATALGEDVDIIILPGEWWAFDYERNAITFPLLDLVTVPPEKIIGSLLHEIGHYQITRLDAKHPVFARLLSSESLRLLLNTFEDARASNWMKATFKGTAPYFELIYDDLLSEDFSATAYSYKLQKEVQRYSNSTVQAYQVLPHLEYLLCVLYFWRFGRLPPHVTNPRVTVTLENTVQFFEPIFDHFPPGRATEQEKLRYAREAAEQIESRILESYEELLSEAARNLTLGIEQGQQPLGEGENPSEINPQELEQEAQEILEDQAKELADRLSAKRNLPTSVNADALEQRIGESRDTLDGMRISADKPHSELTRRDLIAQRRHLELERSRTVNEYQRAYAAVSALLHMLVGTLENFLAKNRKPKYEGYYASGQKPDLRRVMDVTRKMQQGLPTTRKDFDVFLKRRRPTRLDHRIMLLLDESGSMQEPKRTAALQALLLFMEAFDYLAVDYAIIGFADAPIVHKPFGDALTQRAREDVFEDVSQFIPLGATADADALAMAIDLFDREPEDVYRLIIVISDGEGNVNTTGKTFEELQGVAATKAISVVGIGIGEQPKTFRARYAHPVHVADVSELPLTLGRVLQEGVTSDESQ
ncbi:MAG TPA: VWA domain-containing protein [Candidatus Bathyarchaeia archaeon]|nr:VWA domain-containing protein [Candidatus Bathyarchaeia archaeon]